MYKLITVLCPKQFEHPDAEEKMLELACYYPVGTLFSSGEVLGMGRPGSRPGCHEEKGGIFEMGMAATWSLPCHALPSHAVFELLLL